MYKARGPEMPSKTVSTQGNSMTRNFKTTVYIERQDAHTINKVYTFAIGINRRKKETKGRNLRKLDKR